MFSLDPLGIALADKQIPEQAPGFLFERRISTTTRGTL
jgi:hypothetical protein